MKKPAHTRSLHGPDHPGHPRSPHWHAAALAHLRLHPGCVICGRTDHVQVHHKKSYHEHPESELDPDNFATVCEGRGTDSHHRWFGHLGDFQCINPCFEQWRQAVGERAGTKTHHGAA